MVSGPILCAGLRHWSLALPAAPDDSPHTLTTGVVPSQASNILNTAFLVSGGHLRAVDPAGTLLWSLPWDALPGSASFSGWQNATDAGGGVVYLAVVQPEDTTAPSLRRNTTLTAVAVDSGELLWVTNLTAYGTAAFGVVPISRLAPAPAVLLFANGNKVEAVKASTGEPAWSYIWAVAGTGLAANITDLQYVGLPSSPADKLVLLTSTAWLQQRYAVLRLGAGASAGWQPGAEVQAQRAQQRLLPLGADVQLLWQSSLPEAAMDAYPPLAAPVVSAVLGCFYYWTNTTIYYPALTWQMELVARSLLTGQEVWRKSLPRAGSSEGAGQLPAAPLAAVHDRLFAVTTDGLAALNGATGDAEWSVAGTPYEPNIQGTPGGYTYIPAPAFTDTSGYVVAMRCLGEEGQQQQNGTVCVYGGYEGPADTRSAALGGSPPAATVLALGLLVWIWLLG
ncbi:hypothetical protein N2152v2_008898 [Parachlorella kessleri]